MFGQRYRYIFGLYGFPNSLMPQEVDNEYIIKWLGHGKFCPWSDVLASLSRGDSKDVGLCPHCHLPMRETFMGVDFSAHSGQSGAITFCLECRYQHSTQINNAWIN